MLGVFSNTGQVFQTLFALISACGAATSGYFLLKTNHALPAPKWVLGVVCVLCIVVSLALVFGGPSQKKSSLKIVEPYFVVHVDDHKFPQVTWDAKIVNTGESSDVLLSVAQTLRRGGTALIAPLVPGIREISAKWGQILPCELPPGKTFFMEAKSGIVLTQTNWSAVHRQDGPPFTLDCKFVFAKAKALKVKMRYPP